MDPLQLPVRVPQSFAPLRSNAVAQPNGGLPGPAITGENLIPNLQEAVGDQRMVDHAEFPAWTAPHNRGAEGTPKPGETPRDQQPAEKKELTAEDKVVQELGLKGPLDQKTKGMVAQLAQLKQAKEAQDKENARDPKVRLQEAMGDNNKATSFMSWLTSDMSAAPGGMSPSAALQQLMGEPDSAGQLLKLRGTAASGRTAGLEARFLDVIGKNTSLSAANQKAMADNMAGEGVNYLSAISNNSKLSAKYTEVQANAASSGEGRAAMKDYYKALASNPGAAAADAKVQEKASASEGGKSAIATLQSNLAQDPSTAAAAVEAQAAASRGGAASSIAKTNQALDSDVTTAGTGVALHAAASQTPEGRSALGELYKGDAANGGQLAQSWATASRTGKGSGALGELFSNLSKDPQASTAALEVQTKGPGSGELMKNLSNSATGSAGEVAMMASASDTDQGKSVVTQFNKKMAQGEGAAATVKVHAMATTTADGAAAERKLNENLSKDPLAATSMVALQSQAAQSNAGRAAVGQLNGNLAKDSKDAGAAMAVQAAASSTGEGKQAIEGLYKGLAKDKAAAGATMAMQAAASQSPEGLKAVTEFNHNVSKDAGASSGVAEFQATATSTGGGMAAYAQLNRNLAKNPEAAASAVELHASASSTDSGRKAITQLNKNLAKSADGASSQAVLMGTAAESAQGREAFKTLNTNLAKDPEAATAAMQMRATASTTKEGRAGLARYNEGLAQDPKAAASEMKLQASASDTKDGLEAIAKMNENQAKYATSAGPAIAMQAAATRTPEGLAAKMKLNNNLAKNSRAAASEVALEATAAKSKGGRKAVSDLWGNLSSNPQAATSEVKMQLAGANGPKGGDAIGKLYKRMAGDEKGAAAARQLLDSAASTKEGRGPTEQLRQVIDQRMKQPDQDEAGPRGTAGQPQQPARTQNAQGGELTQSEQNQQAHEQAEEAEEGGEGEQLKVRPMHLFVDGRMADTPHLHGIARYLYTIIEWGTRNRPQHKISVAARNPDRWRALPVEVVKVRSKPFSIHEWVEFYWLLRNSPYDHVHFPSLAVPIWCPKRYSMTVHDLIPWHYPSSPLVRLYLTTVARWTVRQAHTVLSASRHTAKDLQKYLGFPADQVLVIYHGGLEGDPLEPDAVTRPYLLCVTNPKPHKNLHTLLQAFRGLEDRCRLVVVCSDCPQLNPAPPGVERLSGLSDEEIRRLYANASVAIVPSFQEGFGLPALEAMLLGAPLISSFATSLPEVTGDAALLFNPHDADELRQKIIQVLENPELANDLRKRGRERAQTFSWEKSARQHWDYFEQTASNRADERSGSR